jgi:predicted DNA-binding transcriptional regulator
LEGRDDKRGVVEETANKDRKVRPAPETITGTTRRVYGRIYRYGPVRLHELQKELGLSSSSVAEYHVNKLLRMGLIRESAEGYVTDRVIVENMIRIRRTVIPIWTTLAVFFVVSLAVLLSILRPVHFADASYLFSLGVIGVALVVSLYEAITTLRREV